MPGDPKQCRISARRCTELAVRAKDPKLKKKFLDLAGKWTKLAIGLEMVQALTDRPPKKRKKTGR